MTQARNNEVPRVAINQDRNYTAQNSKGAKLIGWRNDRGRK